MKTFAVRILTSFAAFLYVAGAHAADDNYPSKIIHIIIPAPPGGGLDVIARLLADQLRAQLGQAVIVENRTGAGGNIAMAYLASAPADGYTLLLINSTPTLNQTLFKNLSFDVIKDFKPVALAAHNGPTVLVGRPDLPFSNLAGLVDYARKNPNKLSYAACDTGSSFHVGAEVLKTDNELDIVHVPYKGCSDPIPNLLGGQIDIAFTPMANVDSYIKSGKMKAFALTSQKRSVFAPDIPTSVEQGQPRLVIDAWYGLIAPGKTPDAIVAKLNQAVNKALAMDATRKALQTIMVEPGGGSPQDFGRMIRSEVERYAALIEETHITVEQ